ncbi:apolipoprotein A-I-like [Hyla sarda]|uniref:apolipoprotein A-I-like n=1 Tax=Hyla sarda TaxID=327740 RepID=UPI0024C229F5|nr:apolipoprotein A-I-like [Hyla sarda]
MKVLLLSVAVLFFTGAQGRYFWQQDEPHQEPHSDKTIEKIAQDGIAIVTELWKNFDLSKIAKEYQIKERLQTAKKHAKKLEEAIESYYDEVFKKFDEQLHEKFPTFRTKVVPILKDFDDALEEQLTKVAKEIVPVGSDLIVGITKHLGNFFENLESVAEKGRDALRGEIDSLRVKLQPYVDEVHAEYERYRKDFQGELQKDYTELKQDVEKNVEKIREQAKPHIENLKQKFPDRKEFQENVEKFLKELTETLEKM